MKTLTLTAISDTHNRHRKMTLPETDIIVHAGDATSMGYVHEVTEFMKWYGSLDYQLHIFIPGNHDWLFEKQPALAKQICEDNGVILLNDSGMEIDGFNFWGSPVQPYFCNWAFNRYRGEDIKKHWNLIPNNTDVLITHGPPHMILDRLEYVDGTPKDEWVGCEMLTEAIKRVKPQIHLFGHVHCGYGEHHEDGVSYYNVSICDEAYFPSNPPTVIELLKDEK